MSENETEIVETYRDGWQIVQGPHQGARFYFVRKGQSCLGVFPDLAGARKTIDRYCDNIKQLRGRQRRP